MIAYQGSSVIMRNSENVIRLARSYLQYQVDVGFAEMLLPARRSTTGGTPRTLDAVREELGECTRCPLHKTRRTIVFGEGNPAARLMFIGEGPGADEDRQGRPFVGKAGQLLTRMIQAMGLERSDVYIANMVKCRPPKNRNPLREEMQACLPFLEAQIAVVNPEVIVALGKVAAGALLETGDSISALRGRFHYRNGVPVMPTYHPSFLLRQEPDRRCKAEAWADLQEVMALLRLPLPRTGDQP